jgi:hypothetical protein
MSEIFKTVIAKLPNQYKNQLNNLFNDYGKGLEIPLGSALLYAQDASKLEEALRILKENFENNVKYQHPEIREFHDQNAYFFNDFIKSLGVAEPV